jgi:Ca2+-binding RTX toxin-like protein
MAKIKGNKKGNKLKGTKKNDKILGLAGDDKLSGGAGNDTLDAGSGDDSLKGGGGKDRLIAGDGSQSYNGGGGDDTVSFARLGIGVGVDLLTGARSGGAADDTFTSIENLEGSAFADALTGNAGNNTLLGLASNDDLDGGGGNDRLDGGDGNDLVAGGAGSDEMIGGNGIDTLFYLGGAGISLNLATGAAGGGAAGDTFSGFENVIGSAFDDAVTGNDAANILTGGNGADDLVGGKGGDTLNGGAGADDLNGGDGNDRLIPEGSVAGAAGQAGDDIVGGAGSDWVDYSIAGSAVIVLLDTGVAGGQAAGDTYSSVENVQGTAFADTLMPADGGRAYGSGGDDDLRDADGTEVLRGGAGADDLDDSTLGEDGKTDIFFLEVGLGRDDITGFTEDQDLFWLPRSQFGDLVFNADGILAGGQILNNPNPAATIAAAQLIYDNDDKIFYYDKDGTGSGASVQVARIVGAITALELADFLIVSEV